MSKQNTRNLFQNSSCQVKIKNCDAIKNYGVPFVFTCDTSLFKLSHLLLPKIRASRFLETKTIRNILINLSGLPFFVYLFIYLFILLGGGLIPRRIWSETSMMETFCNKFWQVYIRMGLNSGAILDIH